MEPKLDLIFFVIVERLLNIKEWTKGLPGSTCISKFLGSPHYQLPVPIQDKAGGGQ